MIKNTVVKDDLLPATTVRNDYPAKRKKQLISEKANTQENVQPNTKLPTFITQQKLISNEGYQDNRINQNDDSRDDLSTESVDMSDVNFDNYPIEIKENGSNASNPLLHIIIDHITIQSRLKESLFHDNTQQTQSVKYFDKSIQVDNIDIFKYLENTLNNHTSNNSVVQSILNQINSIIHETPLREPLDHILDTEQNILDDANLDDNSTNEQNIEDTSIHDSISVLSEIQLDRNN